MSKTMGAATEPPPRPSSISSTSTATAMGSSASLQKPMNQALLMSLPFREVYAVPVLPQMVRPLTAARVPVPSVTTARM